MNIEVSATEIRSCVELADEGKGGRRNTVAHNWQNVLILSMLKSGDGLMKVFGTLSFIC